MPWNCNFSGECEQSRVGKYSTVEACRADCQGAENKELLYIINSYDLKAAAQLSSSDQDEIVFRLFGFRPHPSHRGKILTQLLKLDSSDWSVVGDAARYIRTNLLQLYPQLTPYVQEKSAVNLFLAEIAEFIVPPLLNGQSVLDEFFSSDKWRDVIVEGLHADHSPEDEASTEPVTDMLRAFEYNFLPAGAIYDPERSEELHGIIEYYLPLVKDELEL